MSLSSNVLHPIPSVTREREPLVGIKPNSHGGSFALYLWLGAALVTSLFANGRWIIPVAAWICPVLLVRYLRDERPLRGFLLAAVGLSLTAFVSWWGMVPAPLVLFFIILGSTALCQLVPFAVDRLLYQRLTGLPRTLVLPTALVSVEFLNSEFSPYGTWGATAYTQVGNLALLQMISVTGVYGVTFLVGWFAAVANDAWEHRYDWRRTRWTVGSLAAVFAIVLLGGAARLAFVPPVGETVRVASITAPDELRNGVDPAHLAADLHVSLDGGTPDIVWQALVRNTRPLNAYLADQSRREARAGAKIVFWPEGQAVAAKEAEVELLQLGRETARGEKIYLGMGMVIAHHADGGTRIENRFLFLDPQGKTLFDYTKQMPVPGGEAACSIIPVHDFQLPVVDTPHGRIAGAICFDMDFPWLIRQAGVKRADMILAPSSDWPAIDPLHTEMAALRGIELGCSVVRHTNAGLSAAVDYQGHILASMDHFTTPGTERVMVTHVPTHGVPTFYARFGDLFSWFCMIGLLALTIFAVVWPRRSPDLRPN